MRGRTVGISTLYAIRETHRHESEEEGTGSMTLWVLCEEHDYAHSHDYWNKQVQQYRRCPGGREASIEDVKVLVNRFEVIDHTSTGEGRWPSKWEDFNFGVDFSLQDQGRTLKVFLTPALDQEKQ